MLTGARPGEAMLAAWDQFDAEPGFWIKPSHHTKQRAVHKLPLSPAAIELIERLRKHRKAGTTWLFPGTVPGKPIAALWHVWGFVRDYATVALWAASTEPNVAAIVSELQRALERRPTIKECQREAKRRGVALPAGLIGARPYDLRHTFASIGASGKLGLPIIGKLLGHTQSRTTQRYAHLADDPVREAATQIATVIERAGQASRNVVPMRKEQ
jgi:integrase